MLLDSTCSKTLLCSIEHALEQGGGARREALLLIDALLTLGSGRSNLRRLLDICTDLHGLDSTTHCEARFVRRVIARLAGLEQMRVSMRRWRLP